MLSRLCPIVCWDEDQSWDSAPLCTESLSPLLREPLLAPVCPWMHAPDGRGQLPARRPSGPLQEGPQGLPEMQLFSLQSGDKEAGRG